MKKQHYDLEIEDPALVYKLESISKILDISINDLIESAIIVYIRVTESAIKRAHEVSTKKRNEILKMIIK